MFGILSFKRRTGLWFGVLIAAVALTGHRLTLSQPRPNRLRFAHTFTTGSERAILDAAIAEFERSHPGVTIQQIISNSEVYNTIGWRLQFRGRNPPDIYFHWQGFKVEYCIKRGWAMDLTPFLSPGFTHEFIPATVREQEGGVYFLPHSVDISNLVWYDRALFERLNLSEPKSLEQWQQVCLSVRRAGILPLAQGNRDLWPMGNLGAEFLGQTLGADATQRLFQPGSPIRPGDLRGLQTLVFLRRNHCLDLSGVLDPGAIGSLSDIDAKVLFLSGKSAQHILGSWFAADIADARQKDELKPVVSVFPVPAMAGGTDALTAVSTGFLVNRRSKNPRAAVEFLELLLSKPYQSQFARSGNLSARRDAPQFTHDPLAKRMLEILAAAPAWVPPPDTGYRPEQAAVFYEMIGRLLTGRLDLENASAYWTKEKENLTRKGL